MYFVLAPLPLYSPHNPRHTSPLEVHVVGVGRAQAPTPWDPPPPAEPPIPLHTLISTELGLTPPPLTPHTRSS